MIHTSMHLQLDGCRPVDVSTYRNEGREPTPQRPFRHTEVVREVSYSGIFHGFSCEGSVDDGLCVVAIVEKPDGTVETPSANCIRFTDTEPSQPL